ncbi:MAG: hypothetical protein E8D41_02315 [Nitrospira sp.]|nr:MAG: hypothetical protein E8D41_02315 [Nitrospira sp.]
MRTFFNKYMPMIACGLSLLSSIALTSCAQSGSASSKYGPATTGNVTMNIGPIGPLVGIGDSVVEAAKASAEAYLKGLNTPLKDLMPEQISTAAEKAVEAANQAATREETILTQKNKEDVKRAVVEEVKKAKERQL